MSGWEDYQQEEQRKRDEGIYEEIRSRLGLNEDDSFLVRSKAGRDRALPLKTLVMELIKVIESQL